MAKGPAKRRRYHKENVSSAEAVLCCWRVHVVTGMKSNLSTKALLGSQLGSRVEESLPQKKRKERRRNKRNKKSSEGCQIKRRKAKKMFPWMFMPGIESGRSRRRRESSGDSRRRRRDRRRRDRTRSRERSRGRSPRSRRSEASSSLPVAEPGYRWCQIPETVLHGGTGPAVARPASPSSSAPCSAMASTTARSPSGGLQLMAAEALAATPENLGPADLEPAWQWQFRQMGPAKGEGLEQMAQEEQSLRREAKFLPQRQLPPGKILTKWRRPQRKRLTARQAEREEEGFHAHLWQEAIQQALADPDRPLCARELVKNGRLTAWWSMSWKDARTQINGALVDEYRDLLRGYFVGPPEGPGMLPELEGRAVEGSIFKVPGQRVVFFPTTIHGPSYKEPANHRNSLTISHGLPWTSALGVGQLGELAPGDFTEGEFPSYGFSGGGSCNEFSQGSIRSSITKVAARAKGKDVILTLEGQLEVNTPQVEGGMYHLNAACRDAGSARSGDHSLLHPRNAVLKGISVPWPV